MGLRGGRPQSAGGGNAALTLDIADQAYVSTATSCFEAIQSLLNLPASDGSPGAIARMKKSYLAFSITSASQRIRAKVNTARILHNNHENDPLVPEMPKIIAPMADVVHMVDDRIDDKLATGTCPRVIPQATVTKTLAAYGALAAWSYPCTNFRPEETERKKQPKSDPHSDGGLGLPKRRHPLENFTAPPMRAHRQSLFSIYG